jgi:hypothetical protein
MYCSASATDWIRSSCRIEMDWRVAGMATELGWVTVVGRLRGERAF